MQKIRIVNDDSKPYGLRIDNADSGEEVHGVSRISFLCDPNKELGKPVSVTIDILAEIDIQVDATVRRMVLDDSTGEYRTIEDGEAIEVEVYTNV